MTQKMHSHNGTRLLVIAAALVIIIKGINQAEPVLAALLVAVFLSIIGTPPVLWLERNRIPSVLAVLIVVAGMIMILLIIGVVVGTSINSFSAALPIYQTRLREKVSVINVFLTGYGIGGLDKVLLGYVKPEEVMRLTAGLLEGLGSALSNIVLILLTVTFILFEASSFPVKLRAALGDPKKVLGVDFPVLWGFLAFLLHYVPNIGFIIAAVPAVLLTLIQLGAGTAALAAAGYLVVDLALGNLFETRLMGRRLGLSTLVVFLSLIVWGSLLGLIGMLLSVPFTMALKFACENSESTRWIAVLLANELSAKDIPPASKKYAL